MRACVQVEDTEKFVEKEEKEVETYVEQELEVGENILAKFGQKLMALFGNLDKGAAILRQDEENFLRELGDEERQLLNDLQMDASEVGKLFGNAIPLRKLR